MMKGFVINQCFLHEFFKEMKVPITVLGPYHHKLKCRRFLVKIFGWPYGKADFFWTEEDAEPRFDLAHKQIGFWTSFKNNKDVYRCPAWMNQLDFPEGDNKASWYYGNKLSIDKLMKPILNSYSYEDIKSRLNKSILISSILGSLAASCECEKDGNIVIDPNEVSEKIKNLEESTNYSVKAKL